MWTVLKFDKKNLSVLKEDLKSKLGNDFEIYIPKLRIQKYQNKKLISKELNLLGDYLFCFHKSLEHKKTVNSLMFIRGLKYFLDGFAESQKDIEKFIKKCKDSESEEGFLSRNFFDLDINKKYRFSSGPFADKIFKIINLQRNRIGILMGNIKTTIKKKEFLFTPA
mgnify:CR=1 FL=1|tara:strand:+ start:93 stop:590 length:498 start_codon:yes stop_codon:yes gene_type:complete